MMWTQSISLTCVRIVLLVVLSLGLLGFRSADDLRAMAMEQDAVTATSSDGVWSSMAPGLSDDVRAVAVAGADVYVGGNFVNDLGNVDADYIAHWDGTEWKSLGSGLNGIVHAIAVVGSDVYVGGEFTDAGGVGTADYVARWGKGYRIYLPLVLRG